MVAVDRRLKCKVGDAQTIEKTSIKVQAGHAHLNVNDILCAQAGHRCGADVVNAQSLGAEHVAKARADLGESFRPRGIVWVDDDSHFHNLSWPAHAGHPVGHKLGEEFVDRSEHEPLRETNWVARMRGP